jgi:CSLREA domain-containing protein
MRRPISALKSRRRQRLGVELLEGRQLLATITVNTAADESAADPTLSLREAIEVSDGTLAISSLSTQEQAQVSGAVGNTNTIDFNIPKTDPGYNATTGVWTIALNSALPAVSVNAAIIDGYSQPGSAENTLAKGDNAKLVIAINGASAATITGLTIGQSGSQVRGLDIENCATSGVTVTAGGNVRVAGCFIGTDPSGETAAPNANGVVIQNSSNLIGGTNVGDRNVISGNSGSGISIPDQAANPLNIEPTGNQIENNYIGTDAAGNKALGNSGAGVYDYGSGNTYGGTTAGLGNVISGNKSSGLYAGGSITIEGNYFGTDATGNVALGNKGSGISTSQDTFGAPILSTIITNNVVSDNGGRGVFVTGSSQPSKATYMIANNLIGTDAAGTAAMGNGLEGLFVAEADNTSILNNVVSANTYGMHVADSVAVIQGNLIGTDKTGQVAFGNSMGGIFLSSSTGTEIGGTGAGQRNVIADNGGVGIFVDGGQQNPITQNSIFGNAGAGIQVQTLGQHVAAPVLSFTPGTGSTGTLSGTLSAAPNTSYTVEIFSNLTLPTAGQEQGKTFIQDVTVKTDGSGHGTFSVTEPTGIYTGTATDPSGNTSPFSNAIESKALPASVTALSSSANPSTVGKPVTFTAVVSAPGYSGTPIGTVTFTIDGHAEPPVHLAVVGGKDEARFTTTTLVAGQHSVSAEYNGDTNVSPSSGSLSTQTVNGPHLQPTTTKLTASSNHSTFGQSVTFTAVVASAFPGMPTGTVTFTVDGVPQSPVPLHVATGGDVADLRISTLSVGTHTVSATYDGDSTFTSSTVSSPLSQVVNRVATTTTLASSADPSMAGEHVTITATVAPKTGTGAPAGGVTFTVDGKVVADVPLHAVSGAEEATFAISTLTVGKHIVGATYDGDAAFASSTVSTPMTQIVNDPPSAAPTVVAVQRFGVHMYPTILVVTFSEPMDPSSAVNLGNYRITGPAGRRIPIASAVFDSTKNAVTLRPSERINVHYTYYLTVIGTGTTGVRSAGGVMLDGNDDGDPGNNYSTTLNWRNLYESPPEADDVSQARQTMPAGPLAHQFLTRSH